MYRKLYIHMIIDIELPFQIGDKIWIDQSSGFGKCNFMERYSKCKQVEITNIQVEYDITTKVPRIVYSVTECDCRFVYTGKVAFTKEQLYEQWREELEQLIPEELRNYLWK